MVQQELFPESLPPRLPPPAVVPVPEPAPRRRLRSEVVAVPFHTGPISHATGGPLSAEESERVVTGCSIRCSGYLWEDGGTACKACFDADPKRVADARRGYRRVLYGGAEYRGGCVCFVCRRPIAP